MEVLDVMLLVMAYSALLLSLFLQVICYKKNIESIETIAFTLSLLLLIVALTLTYLVEADGGGTGAAAFLLLAMTLVGVTTPLNILRERTHTAPAWIRPALIGLGGVIVILICIATITGKVSDLQIPVAVFLGISVVGSMLLIRFSRPQKYLAHREKQEQRMAVVFLVVIPALLLVDFMPLLPGLATQTGLTLPVLFTLLAVGKLWDDMHRLSLFRDKKEVDGEMLQHYGLTEREQDVALLLIQGLPYKEIAAQLYISMPTVKTHVSNIYRKCKVSSRLELMALLGK